MQPKLPWSATVTPAPSSDCTLHDIGTCITCPGANRLRICVELELSAAKPAPERRTAAAVSSLLPVKLPCGLGVQPGQAQLDVPPLQAHRPSTITRARCRGASGRIDMGRTPSRLGAR